MNKDIIFVDIQGFKNFKNDFIVKELSIATIEFTQTFLIKSPYSFHNLSNFEKKQIIWLEKNRGIRWSEGFIDYREFKRVIIPYLENKKILTKGLEKIKWIKELCSTCQIVDIGEKGCPNILKLRNDYCKNNINFNCINHTKECALNNVICIKKWYEDNYMYKFSLFD